MHVRILNYIYISIMNTAYTQAWKGKNTGKYVYVLQQEPRYIIYIQEL
jgi:hypothetical protein